MAELWGEISAHLMPSRKSVSREKKDGGLPERDEIKRYACPGVELLPVSRRCGDEPGMDQREITLTE